MTETVVVTPERTMIEQTLAESVVAEPSPTQDFSQLDERVLAGVRFLDANVPGWAHKINLERFALRHGMMCVLGQCYGDYVIGKQKLGLDTEHTDADCSRYGFYTSGSSGDWDSLETDWRVAIRVRQKLRAPDMSGARS